MHTTPYVLGGLDKSTSGKTALFSRLRTSKIMYMNEVLVPQAMDLSRKIVLDTSKNYRETGKNCNFGRLF